MAQAALMLQTGRRTLILASIFLVLHGLIEVLSLVSIFTPLTFTFAFEELNQNWEATVLVGVVSGILRIAAAVGILSNRMWGWMLGLLMSIITFAMLTLYLPAGATDAVLAGGALFFLLVGRYADARITG